MSASSSRNAISIRSQRAFFHFVPILRLAFELGWIAGSIVKQLSSVVKWPRAASPHAPKHTQYGGDAHVSAAPQFESGYFVETLVEGDKLGVTPHTIRVSPVEGGELLAVDAAHSNIVPITRPHRCLIKQKTDNKGSADSRGRLVAGSFQGHSDHIDGKPSDARLKHPTGVAVDDMGNVYVADAANLAIRKIGESGVTTIAGGKSNMPGYRDGPSEDAKFSTNFDMVYMKKICSLLVIDRGNAALRKITLPQEDCTYPDSTLLSSDIILVIGAVVVGYVFSILQHGFGSSRSEKIEAHEDVQRDSSTIGNPPLVVESLKEEPGAGWPSFGTLVADLLKLAFEVVGNLLLAVAQTLRRGNRKTDLTPGKDRLVMSEDRAENPTAQKLSSTPMRPDPTQSTLLML